MADVQRFARVALLLLAGCPSPSGTPNDDATVDSGSPAIDAGDPDAGISDADLDADVDSGEVYDSGHKTNDAGQSCGVTRRYTYTYDQTVEPINAGPSIIYDSNLYKDNVLDTTCNPPMTFNHVIGNGIVDITGCVDACGAYVSSDATFATVSYGEVACAGFFVGPESYPVPANAAVYNPPCDK